MTPTPLDKIGLRWRDHKSALWWLGLLYRRPNYFIKSFEQLEPDLALEAALRLYVHIFPYLVLGSMLARVSMIIHSQSLSYDPQVPETLAFLQQIIFPALRGGVIGGFIGGIIPLLAFFGLNFTALLLVIGRRISFREANMSVERLAKDIVRRITWDRFREITQKLTAKIFRKIARFVLLTFHRAANKNVVKITMRIIKIFILALLIFIIAIGSALWIPILLALGMALGIAASWTLGLSNRIALAIASAIATGIALGVAIDSQPNIILGIVIGCVYGITLGVAINIAFQKVIDSAAGILLGAFLSALVAWPLLKIIHVPLLGGLAFTICLLRFFYFPFHFLTYFDFPRRLYVHHPIFWDDLCPIPFPRLDQILIKYATKAPRTGKQEIERIIENYPSQRWAALYAKTALLGRQAAKVKVLAELEALLGRLPEGQKGFLAETHRLREIVGEIVKMQIRLNTVDRGILLEPLAQALCEKIENFRHRIAGFHEPLASEFRQAATQWLELARAQLQKAGAILDKESSPVIFRAGDPVNREQEAFVPRYGIVGDLDKQIMLSTGCPGLVLYGRRRMGKSTVLHNLNGFLPATVIPVVISMQDPQAFTSLTDLLYLISQKLTSAVGGETGNPVENISLNLFMQRLAQSNEKLQAAGKRMLLAIDEYENIDRKLGEKIFPEDLLVTVRESIQTHRQITWIFAGSHDITELKHAEWPSYLVSARTIELPVFTPAETRLLLTEPMKFSSLWSKDDPKRPRFSPEFWGENGIERIQHEAGGWPHFVQLLAETIVDLINDETKRQVDAELFERSLNKAIVSGHNVLYQLLRGESTLPGEWEYLAAFRKRETQPPPEDEAIYTSLRRRLLVEEENGHWRLRVPLMARWLKERG